ncbi:MAG: efflux RND transporter periplasmic adaptor subunit [Flavobacteriaceae bacterium]|nr:efflux RND transporter periplasmic adaptor subunit [Flavobacteriaceae bacterium]
MNKKFYLFTLLLLFSCESNETFESIIESNDIEKIKLARKTIVASQQDLNTKIELLDNRIEELNENPQLPIVQVVSIKPSQFDHYIQVQGSVKSDQLINILPEFSGIIKNIYVKSGDQVKKGDPLVKIDDGGLKEQLSQLEIKFELTKTTFERQKRLWEQKIGSEIQFLETKSMFEAQKQAINQLKKQIQKTLIQAPFGGTIDNVIVKLGEVVYPGRSNLMMLLNMDNLYVESNVPEKYISSIKVGNKAILEFPLIGKSVSTIIRQSGNYIHPINRTFKIEMDIKSVDFGVKPNLNSKVRINDYSNKKALMINQNIISVDSNNEEFVYKLYSKNNKDYVSKTTIETGKSDGKNIEVISGLNQGDFIVSEGIRKLVDNSRVKIIK